MKRILGILIIVLSFVAFLDSTDCNALIFKYKKLSRPRLIHPYPGTDSKGYDCTGKIQYFEVIVSKQHNAKFKYKLYRKKAGAKKYKKIKFKFVQRGYVKEGPDDYYGDIIADKSVKTGATYYYKVKAYQKQKKKTIYSKMSKPYKRIAIRDEGIFNVKSLTPKSYTNQVVLKLTSKSDNGPIRIGLNRDDYGFYYDCEFPDLNKVYVKEYSYDNKNWISTGNCWLYAGQQAYLKLEFIDGPYEYMCYDEYSRFEIHDFWYYNHIKEPTRMDFDLWVHLKKGYASSDDWGDW